jgi:RHS repeat-associated protein
MAQYKLGNPGWTGEPRLAFYVEGNVTMYTYFQGMALGSNRLGSMGAQFNPYGVPRTALVEGDGFATYWRDQKTGLDYAINRYYHSALGRFLSPDIGLAVPTAPQSWNRYAYAWNDPVNLNDPDGLLPKCVDSIFREGGDAAGACPYGQVEVDVPGFVGPSRIPIPVFQRAEDLLNNAYSGGLILGWEFTSGRTIDIVLQTCPTGLGVCRAIDIGFKITVGIALLQKVLSDVRNDWNSDKDDCNKQPWPGDPKQELDKPVNQRTSPGPGWEWRGPGQQGSWHNPRTGEYLRPHPADGAHSDHWDYRGPNGWTFRKQKNGDCDPKNDYDLIRP